MDLNIIAQFFYFNIVYFAVTVLKWRLWISIFVVWIILLFRLHELFTTGGTVEQQELVLILFRHHALKHPRPMKVEILCNLLQFLYYKEFINLLYNVL